MELGLVMNRWSEGKKIRERERERRGEMDGDKGVERDGERRRGREET